MAFNSFGGGGGQSFPQRQWFEGNWKCDNCGREITRLPFQPKEGLPIRCRECHMQFKAQQTPA